MKASSDEPPDVKAAQEELGYLGVPPSDASTWFTYKGGLFRVMRVSADDGGAKEIYGPKPRRLPVRELNDHQAFVVR